MSLLHLQPESGPRPHTSTFTCTLTCTAQAVCALSTADKRSVMQERPTGSALLTSYYVVLTTTVATRTSPSAAYSLPT